MNDSPTALGLKVPHLCAPSGDYGDARLTGGANLGGGGTSFSVVSTDTPNIT